MTEEVKNQAPEAEVVEVVEIIRGRMPVVQVHVIRFNEDTDATDAALAAKYRTTNGKISDIRKGRNFGYLTEDTVFSAEEIAKAVERAEGLAEDVKEGVIEVLSALTVGDEDQLKARDELRKSTRKPRGKSKADEAEDTSEAAPEAVEEGEVDLDDLLD